MKKQFLAFCIVLSCAVFSLAQTQPASQTEAAKNISPEAEKASVETVKLFKQQKFDEALPFAQKAVEINARELGVEHLKTAQSYVNLGYVQLGAGKTKEAADAFTKAFTIYDRKTDLTKSNALSFATMLELLGYLKFNQGKQGGSEKFYQRALELREKFNGAEAAETINVLWSLGNLNRSIKDYAQAAELYRRVYEVRLKTLGAGKFETMDAAERRACTLSKMGKSDEAKAFSEQFKTARKAAGVSDEESPTAISGVINGLASDLAKPPYPSEAKQARASGTVNVSITIDENGSVIHACGADLPKAHPALVEASEAAAYQSKFKPTTINGKPVKVTGTLVYNFVAQ